MVVLWIILLCIQDKQTKIVIAQVSCGMASTAKILSAWTVRELTKQIHVNVTQWKRVILGTSQSVLAIIAMCMHAGVDMGQFRRLQEYMNVHAQTVFTYPGHSVKSTTVPHRVRFWELVYLMTLGTAVVVRLCMVASFARQVYVMMGSQTHRALCVYVTEMRQVSMDFFIVLGFVVNCFFFILGVLCGELNCINGVFDLIQDQCTCEDEWEQPFCSSHTCHGNGEWLIGDEQCDCYGVYTPDDYCLFANCTNGGQVTGTWTCDCDGTGYA
jgi:hypothetical protein